MNQPILTVTLNPAIDLTIACDDLVLDTVNIATGGTHRAAGKGINIAKVLSDLGLDVNASGIFGRNNRERFDNFFYSHPIEDHGYYVPGDTRTNVKIHDRSERVTEINLPGLVLDQTTLATFRDHLMEVAEESVWVVLAGSLPAIVPDDFYHGLINDLHSQGINVVLDTSGPALSQAIAAAPYLIKPNRMELEQWHGAPVTTLEKEKSVVQQLLDRGIVHVVVSDGGRGSRWYTSEKSAEEGSKKSSEETSEESAKNNGEAAWEALPPKVPVLSTVGAGDSLVAGIVSGLAQNWSPQRSLQQATAVAALAVTQIGVGIPTPSALASMLEQVTVRPLNAGGQ